MKTKLSTGAAANLFIALKTVDEHEKVELTGRTRLHIAMNMNRLEPSVLAYDRARNKQVAKILEKHGGGKEAQASPLAQSEATVADAELRAVEIDVDLVMMKVDDFKLDDNPRIRGVTLSHLAPVISDFDKDREPKREKTV